MFKLRVMINAISSEKGWDWVGQDDLLQVSRYTKQIVKSEEWIAITSLRAFSLCVRTTNLLAYVRTYITVLRCLRACL